jgi:methylmalonyl-CoA mutase N-terminal domain/subunit
VSADPSYTYGPPDLCAWKVAPGIFWLQTMQYARKLDKRKDTRRLGITGVNHYRRTYETRGNWRKIKRIVDRYLMSAGDTFSGAESRQGVPELAPKVRTASNRKSANLREVATQC